MSRTISDSADSQLAKKVEKLLQDDKESLYPNERKLTALVLLMRMNDTEQLWRTYPQLSTFAIELVKDHPDTPVYARLLARLLHGNPLVDQDGSVLLSVLERRRSTNTSIRIVDVEILESLQVCLSSNQNWNLVDERLQQVWNLYDCREPDTTSFRKDDVSHKDSSGTDSKAYETMIQTMTALLDQESNFKNETDNELIDSWHEQMIVLILQNTLRLMEQGIIPMEWDKILNWWIHAPSANYKNSLFQVRRSWAQVLLLSTQSLTTFCLAEFQQRLSHQETLAFNLTQLLQTCVVSVEESDQLRGMAWSTTADLVESCGWNWLCQTDTTTTTLSSTPVMGQAHSVCTLIRMAAGEWKIQLGLVLHSNSQSALAEEKKLLTSACAQVLVQAINYVVELADKSEKSVLPLSVDAIMHLRQSLEESLDSAVQYLGLSERRIPEVDLSVVRVLAALLAEFDVFEQRRSRQEEENNENETLQALRVALEINGIEAHEHVVPCLASVFASAEGDDSRISLLKEYGLLGDAFLDFMEGFWKKTTNLSCIPWACQAIETWSSLSRVSETSQLLSWIIEWIQRALTQSPSKELATSLSSVIGCYVTLQGDEPPDEPDATILQRALEVCSRCEAGM